MGFAEIAHIDGVAERDQFGLDVEISDDGQTVAASTLSSLGRNSGIVTVYRFANSGKGLENLGEPILGESSRFGENLFGHDLALSGNGNVVAIGDAQFTSVAHGGGGYVKVLEWNGAKWERVGPLVKLPSDIYYRSFGESVSISKDGSNLAVSWMDYDWNHRFGTFDAVKA